MPVHHTDDMYDDTPDEIHCYLCYLEEHGTPDYDGNKGPLRKVVSEFTTNVPADPTAAYRLECGHTII